MVAADESIPRKLGAPALGGTAQPLSVATGTGNPNTQGIFGLWERWLARPGGQDLERGALLEKPKTSRGRSRRGTERQP